MKRGRLITFEGTDGAGKSTQVERYREWLGRCGIETLVVREPGSTDFGEALRKILLEKSDIDPKTETMLFFAARRELLRQKIRPALAAGQWVLCDRFTDSTRAYQGGGRGVASEMIEQLADAVQAGIEPDITFWLASPPAHSSRRSAETFESQGGDFYGRVHDAYARLAEVFSERIRKIETFAGEQQLDVDSVHHALRSHTLQRFPDEIENAQ